MSSLSEQRHVAALEGLLNRFQMSRGARTECLTNSLQDCGVAPTGGSKHPGGKKGRGRRRE
jgi:hypothetical protein